MMELSPDWEFVSDTVMGGVSSGKIEKENVFGRDCVRLKGQVSLDNNGGFLQMAFNFQPDGGLFDASSWRGIEFDLRGNAEEYDVRLRTDELSRPWQSFRKAIVAPKEWTTVQCFFDDFEAHRTEARLNLSRLRRLGIVAVGRAFDADIAVSAVRLIQKK